MINITLLKLKNCPKCEKAQEAIIQAKKNYSIELKEIWFETDEGKSLAVKTGVKYAPAIIINNKMFCQGGFSEIRLMRKLEELA